MQVVPIKPTLKAPIIKLLKLTYDKPLSELAFKFNLRRYTVSVAPPIGVFPHVPHLPRRRRLRPLLVTR